MKKKKRINVNKKLEKIKQIIIIINKSNNSRHADTHIGVSVCVCVCVLRTHALSSTSAISADTCSLLSGRSLQNSTESQKKKKEHTDKPKKKHDLK